MNDSIQLVKSNNDKSVWHNGNAPAFTRAQISFSKDADLNIVRSQLQALSTMTHIEFYCGFLCRRHIEEKGFGTEIVDLLDETLGKNLTYMNEAYETFDEVMKNIGYTREILGSTMDRIYVLGVTVNPGVKEEVLRVSNNKVHLFTEAEGHQAASEEKVSVFVIDKNEQLELELNISKESALRAEARCKDIIPAIVLANGKDVGYLTNKGHNTTGLQIRTSSGCIDDILSGGFTRLEMRTGETGQVFAVLR